MKLVLSSRRPFFRPLVLAAAWCVLLLGSITIARAQDRATPLDETSSRAALSPQVKKPRFTAKGMDPVKTRFYTKDALVITRASGAQETHPYTPVPLLFRVNSDDLLDDVSRANVVRLAGLIKELAATGQSAFAIEGHASAEGDTQHNRELSEQRARKISALLQDNGVPAGVLARVDGFGSLYAQHPATAAPDELQQDRRVLVVKER